MAVLVPSNVPANLRKLIPLTERFGVIDDLERENLVLAASDDEINQLRSEVSAHDDELDAWLAGPEADGPEFSTEYLAFSAMRMAADFA